MAALETPYATQAREDTAFHELLPFPCFSLVPLSLCFALFESPSTSLSCALSLSLCHSVYGFSVLLVRRALVLSLSLVAHRPVGDRELFVASAAQQGGFVPHLRQRLYSPARTLVASLCPPLSHAREVVPSARCIRFIRSTIVRARQTSASLGRASRRDSSHGCYHGDWGLPMPRQRGTLRTREKRARIRFARTRPIDRR